MSAIALIRRRIVLAADAFAEIVVWRVSTPLPASAHVFRYRLAYIVKGKCVLRYDNERGKGDHRHIDDQETPYTFSSPDQLMQDFMADIGRWNHDHSVS